MQEITPINTGGHYAPRVSYSQQPPATMPQAHNIRFTPSKPDWGADLVNASAQIMKSYTEGQAKALKDQKEEADTNLRNGLAREVIATVQAQRQGNIDALAANTRLRTLKDVYIAGGGDEKDAEEIVKRHGGAIPSIDDEHEKFWAKKDDEYLNNAFAQLQKENLQLQRLSPTVGKQLLLNTRNNVDAAIRQKAYIDGLPEGEEKEAAMGELKNLMGKNIFFNLALKIGNKYAGGQIANEEDFYTARESAINFAMTNGLSNGAATVLTDEVFKAYGVGQGLEDFKRYLGKDAAFYEQVNKQILARSNTEFLSMPGMAVAVNFLKMPGLSQQAQVDLWDWTKDTVKTVMGKYTTDKKGKKTNAKITSMATPEQVVSYLGAAQTANENGSVPDYTALRIAGAGLQMFNETNTITPETSPNDAYIVAMNAKGVDEHLNMNILKRRIKTLKDSPDKEDNDVGQYAQDQLDEKQANTFAANFKNPNETNWEDRNAMLQAGYTIDGDGHLTRPDDARQERTKAFNKYLDTQMDTPEARIAGLEKAGFKKQGLEDLIGVAGYTAVPEGLTTNTSADKDRADIINILKRIATASVKGSDASLIKEANAAEYIPTGGELSAIEMQQMDEQYKQQVAQELLRRADALEESTANLDEAAKKEYGKGNARAIKAARDKAAELLTASASVSNSSVVGGASVAMPDLMETADLSIWKDVEEYQAAQEQRTFDTEMNTLGAAMEQIESAGNPNAVSDKGARGLMQLMPDTYKDIAKRYGLPEDGIDDPEINRTAGKLYMQELKERYDNDITKTVAAYNMGPTALDKVISKYPNTWEKHLPKETENHIKKFYRALNQLTASASVSDSSVVGGASVASSRDLARARVKEAADSNRPVEESEDVKQLRQQLDIEERKSDLQKLIEKVNDEKLIEAIREFIDRNGIDVE